jgi:hypothetical protein
LFGHVISFVITYDTSFCGHAVDWVIWVVLWQSFVMSFRQISKCASATIGMFIRAIPTFYFVGRSIALWDFEPVNIHGRFSSVKGIACSQWPLVKPDKFIHVCWFVTWCTHFVQFAWIWRTVDIYSELNRSPATEDVSHYREIITGETVQPSQYNCEEGYLKVLSRNNKHWNWSTICGHPESYNT